MPELMELLIDLNNRTVGRDKLARLLQYTSKMLWSTLENHRGSRNTIEKFKTLEYTFGSFRKLLRFGRCIDVFYNGLKCDHPDHILRLTTSGSKFMLAVYLFCDHVVWLGRVGLFDIDTTKWNKISYRNWMYAILVNLIRDYYEIHLLRAHLKGNEKTGKHVPLLLLLQFIVKHRKDLLLDTGKNLFDIILPLAALNIVKIDPGIVGWCGIASSIFGLLPLITPTLKLTPS